MSLVLPNRKLVQPVIGSLPIPGCRALFDMRWGVDLVTGRLASANTATRATGPQGQAYDYSTTANTQFASTPFTALTGASSWIVFFDLDALTGYAPLISKAASATTHMPVELRLGSASSTNSLMGVVRANAGGYRQYSAGAVNRFSAASKGNIAAVTFEDGTLTTAPTIFTNGQFFTGTPTGGSGTGTVSDNGASVYLGARQAGVTQLDGRIYWAAAFDRKLDAGELLDIWADPSIIFPTQPRRSRVGAAGAPPSGFLGAWVRQRAQVIGAGVH